MNRSWDNSRNNSFDNSYRSRKHNSSSDNSSSQSQCTSPQEMFIPLNSSSPMGNNRRYSGGNQGRWRNSGGDGYGNRGRHNNFHQQPQQYTPYKGNRNSFGNRSQGFSPNFSPNNSPYRNNRSNYSKKPFNVADYFDPKSIFEDPWEKLMKAHLQNCGQLNESSDSSYNSSKDTISESPRLTIITDQSCSLEASLDSSLSERSIDNTIEEKM